MRTGIIESRPTALASEVQQFGFCLKLGLLRSVFTAVSLRGNFGHFGAMFNYSSSQTIRKGNQHWQNIGIEHRSSLEHEPDPSPHPRFPSQARLAKQPTKNSLPYICFRELRRHVSNILYYPHGLSTKFPEPTEISRH